MEGVEGVWRVWRVCGGCVTESEGVCVCVEGV